MRCLGDAVGAPNYQPSKVPAAMCHGVEFKKAVWICITWHNANYMCNTGTSTPLLRIFPPCTPRTVERPLARSSPVRHPTLRFGLPRSSDRGNAFQPQY